MQRHWKSQNILHIPCVYCVGSAGFAFEMCVCVCVMCRHRLFELNRIAVKLGRFSTIYTLRLAIQFGWYILFNVLYKTCRNPIRIPTYTHAQITCSRISIRNTQWLTQEIGRQEVGLWDFASSHSRIHTTPFTINAVPQRTTNDVCTCSTKSTHANECQVYIHFSLGLCLSACVCVCMSICLCLRVSVCLIAFYCHSLIENCCAALKSIKRKQNNKTSTIFLV